MSDKSSADQGRKAQVTKDLDPNVFLDFLKAQKARLNNNAASSKPGPSTTPVPPKDMYEVVQQERAAKAAEIAAEAGPDRDELHARGLVVRLALKKVALELRGMNPEDVSRLHDIPLDKVKAFTLKDWDGLALKLQDPDAEVIVPNQDARFLNTSGQSQAKFEQLREYERLFGNKLEKFSDQKVLDCK